jgi:hypothetical protein
MKKVQPVSSPLVNSKGSADQTAYQAMATYIRSMSRRAGARDKIRVLSFPGAHWKWETYLAEAFNECKFAFTGLEQNKRVHLRAESLARLLGKNYKMSSCGSFADMAAFFSKTRKSAQKGFDVIYLDWAGGWSPEKMSDIKALLARGCMLNVGGILLFNIALRQECPSAGGDFQDESYHLPMTFYDARGEGKKGSDLKVRGVPEWVLQQARDVYGVRLRPVMASIYYSLKGDEQMLPELKLMFLREED